MSSIIQSNYKREVLQDAEIAIKYDGYIQREKRVADKISRLENLRIPEGFDFSQHIASVIGSYCG